MKEGKFLEMIVECLQQLLISEGLTVSRNQKFYNDNGVQIGEVDVVIEGIFDSKYIKIGTECRDRNGRQDRNWIRQIIGKREDLAERGFTHWIAVSRYGFTSTAAELAEKAKIRLLVPGSASPVEPEKNGPHNWAQFEMTGLEWNFGQFTAKVQYDNDEISEEVMNDLEKKIQKETYITSANSDPISLADFIKSHAESYVKTIERSDDKILDEKTHLLKFDSLDALVCGVKFKFTNFQFEVNISEKTFTNNFSMLAFAIWDSKQVLGLICINEYRHKGELVRYLLVGVNPHNMDEPIMLHRDAEGNPIANQEIRFMMPQYPPEIPVRTIYFGGKKNNKRSTRIKSGAFCSLRAGGIGRLVQAGVNKFGKL